MFEVVAYDRQRFRLVGFQKLQSLQRSPDDSLDLLRVALNLVRVDGEAAETQVRDVAEVKEIIKAEFFGS